MQIADRYPVFGLLLIAFLLSFNLFSSSPAAAETAVPETGELALAEQLFHAADYRLALFAYRRLQIERPDHPEGAAIALRVAECRLALDEWEAGETALQQVSNSHPLSPEAVRATLLYADLPYHRGDYPRARQRYRLLQSDATPAGAERLGFRLAWSYLAENSLERARDAFAGLQQEEAQKISVQLADLAANPEKSPTGAGLLSAVLPGSGQLYTGHYRSAGLALLLNAAFIGATVEAYGNGLPILGSILLAMELGWYSGNIYNAVNLAQQRNQRQLAELRQDLWRNHSFSFDLREDEIWFHWQTTY